VPAGPVQDAEQGLVRSWSHRQARTTLTSTWSRCGLRNPQLQDEVHEVASSTWTARSSWTTPGFGPSQFARPGNPFLQRDQRAVEGPHNFYKSTCAGTTTKVPERDRVDVQIHRFLGGGGGGGWRGAGGVGEVLEGGSGEVGLWWRGEGGGRGGGRGVGGGGDVGGGSWRQGGGRGGGANKKKKNQNKTTKKISHTHKKKKKQKTKQKPNKTPPTKPKKP